MEANFNVMEEPELIGKCNKDWQFRMIAGTASNTTAGEEIGAQAGYFNSKHTCGVKKTFCPEHGLIAFYLVHRVDPFYKGGAQNPILGKNARNAYWSPEFESRKDRVQRDRVFFDDGGPTPDNTTHMVNYDEYRVGQNCTAEVVSLTDQDSQFGMFVDTNSLSDIDSPSSTAFDSFFDTSRMTPNTRRTQVTTTFAIKRSSPVRRSGQQQALY